MQVLKQVHDELCRHAEFISASLELCGKDALRQEVLKQVQDELRRHAELISASLELW